MGGCRARASAASKSRFDQRFPVLFKGRSGTLAHECIVDLRMCKSQSGIEAVDVAMRLMDYGFHAPALSTAT